MEYVPSFRWRERCPFGGHVAVAHAHLDLAVWKHVGGHGGRRARGRRCGGRRARSGRGGGDENGGGHDQQRGGGCGPAVVHAIRLAARSNTDSADGRRRRKRRLKPTKKTRRAFGFTTNFRQSVRWNATITRRTVHSRNERDGDSITIVLLYYLNIMPSRCLRVSSYA